MHNQKRIAFSVGICLKIIPITSNFVMFLAGEFQFVIYFYFVVCFSGLLIYNEGSVKAIAY